MSVENKNKEVFQDSVNNDQINLKSHYPKKKDGEIEKTVGY